MTAVETISFEQLKSWLGANKTRGRIEFDTLDDPTPETTINGWQSQAVEPPTPLSCILFLTDSMYSHVPPPGRHALLRDKCTELESSFTSLLKGRQFPVRRTAEAIISASMGGSDACSALGWNALCRLFEMQIVWFDEGTKLIQFYPEAVSEWDSEKPIHFMSCLANQVWIPPSNWKQSDLGLWLANKESEGWRVKYDEADGSMEELKELAKKIDYQLNIKVNKAELQKNLGRARAVKHLASW